MKVLLGAIALLTAAPVLAQAAPATDPHAGHGAAVQSEQHKDHAKHMEAMHKECREMMDKHAAKMGAAKVDKEVNGNGHKDHNH